MAGIPKDKLRFVEEMGGFLDVIERWKGTTVVWKLQIVAVDGAKALGAA